MIHQIGGGGLAVGAGDENDLAVVDPLEIPYKVLHQTGGDLSCVVAAAAAVDEVDRNGHQLGNPKCDDKFHALTALLSVFVRNLRLCSKKYTKATCKYQVIPFIRHILYLKRSVFFVISVIKYLLHKNSGKFLCIFCVFFLSFMKFGDLQTGKMVLKCIRLKL